MMAILTKSEIPERFKDLQVNYVTVGETAEEARIQVALQRHYRLLVALSLINLPIGTETLKRWEFGREADDLFESSSDLFVKTFGGFVIRGMPEKKCYLPQTPKHMPKRGSIAFN